MNTLLFSALSLIPYPQSVEVDSSCQSSVNLHVDSVFEAGIPPEAYEIQLAPQGIHLKASSDAGFFYAHQTLKQLKHNSNTTPCMNIKDQPRFSWRGLHLDVARHFHDSSHIVQLLHRMAELKLNTFHWHLTDDQGWRIEIPKYPKLTEIGAWRVDRSHQHWNQRTPAQSYEKATYGGYYTQSQIKGILAEAQKLHIQVIPEIEIPAHAAAALAAYPEFSCTGQAEPVPTGGVWPENKVFCPAKDSTLKFLEHVVGQIAQLFPGPWVHLGTDEAELSDWDANPIVQKTIQEKGLKNSKELQAWLHQHLSLELQKYGKKSMAWDEILHLSPTPQTGGVMVWHDSSWAHKSTALHIPTVIAYENLLYLDHYQDPSPYEPTTIGGLTTLKDVFEFSLDSTLTHNPHILGIQAQLWAEYMPTWQHLTYMLYPRLFALAERAWSPIPTDKNGYTHFVERLGPQEKYLRSLGIQFESQALRPTLRSTAQKGVLKLDFQTVLPKQELKCLLNQNDSWEHAFPCTKGLILKEPARLQVAVFDGNQRIGKALRTELTAHKALGSTLSSSIPLADKFNGKNLTKLTDGHYGSNNFGDLEWVAQEGEDFSIQIHLAQKQNTKGLKLGLLNDPNSWIFAPLSVEIWGSPDAQNWQKLGTFHKPDSLSAKGIWRPEAKWPNTSSKHLKLQFQTQKKCPQGHIGYESGGKAWTFMDEIEVF